jgi:hypothetical protein
MERKQKKIEEIKQQREWIFVDLDAIEMAKAPPTKRGDAVEVGESIIDR